MEKIVYESRPFLYLILAGYALVYGRDSILMEVSGSLLLLCAITIVSWRAKYRGYLR